MRTSLVMGMAIALLFAANIIPNTFAQSAPAQSAMDSHETWDEALRAAALSVRLPENETQVESYQKDKKQGESISITHSTLTVVEGGYRISSRSAREETEIHTDTLLRITWKQQRILDGEWQKRLGWTQMETRVEDDVANWTRQTGPGTTESGSSPIEENSIDMSLMGPALALLVNAGRRAPLEATLPMGSMNVDIHFTFRETDKPLEESRPYPFPAGWEPTEAIKGILVEMRLTGAPALVWRHRQYFFFTQSANGAGSLQLVIAWGGDPKWPSIQRIANS